MTKIKLCGLTRLEDIQAANRLRPDYVGFVFAPKSRRYVTTTQAKALKEVLDEGIQAVGVFVDAPMDQVARLLHEGVIDVAQLHGHEEDGYIQMLRRQTERPIWQAFQVRCVGDLVPAQTSAADCILLDSGTGTGQVFDWNLLRYVDRPYFLAGGLDAQNVSCAVRQSHPYGVDVSSGIETDGRKDQEKMAQFVAAVRKEAMP